MMKYEICNPSDECYLESEDPKIAITACLVLGKGLYGLKDSHGKIVCPVLRFGGAKEFLTEEFGGEDAYASFLAKSYVPLAECLDSVSLPHERSSMNDIKTAATKLAVRLRKQA